MSIRSSEDVAAALLEAGRPKEALLAIEGEAKSVNASHGVLARYSSALKALDRMEECLAVRRTAASRFPESGVAWHNLASILGDIGLNAEACEACRRAFSAGLDAPETWLIYGRALAGEGRFEEASAALGSAIQRRSGYADALSEKAKLTWMVSGDAEAAADVFPKHPTFALAIAGFYRSVGEGARALAVLEEAGRVAPGDAALARALAGVAIELGDGERAVSAAERALRLAPQTPAVMETWVVSRLTVGRVDEALAMARRLVALQPHSQSALAVCSVAARLADAPEYRALCDYDTFVRAADIGPPAGWATTGAYLADLRATLNALHERAALQLGQSLRHGTQTTPDLRVVDAPALKAFFAAIDPLIRDYMSALGEGSDPLRARNTGRYALTGCWSIRLRAGGHHVDHMHPNGWLSSAFYVDVPEETLAGDDRPGWIQFGKPNFRTVPALEPAHFERPAPGRLVLFPSYMWHGTVPFSSPDPRMTIAFDVAPA